MEYRIDIRARELFRRSFTRVLETGPSVRFRIENRNGLISVRSHERPEVVINVTAEVYAESSAAADEEVERLKRAIRTEDGRVEVITPELPQPAFSFFGRGPRVDYEVFLPYESSVQATSRNARIEVRRLRGPVHAESRNGPVNVEDVAGGASISLTNGKATLVRIGGHLEARTTNGGIDIQQAAGAVKASTTNGLIRFRGPVGGDIEMSAANGGIRLAVPSGSRFEIDAESRNGAVRSDLRVRQEPAGAGPRPKVRLRTTNGGIHIQEL
jgi:hypothetical protein